MTPNEPKEVTRHHRLVTTQEYHRSPQLPRLHRILQILQPQLFKNCLTTTRIDEENHPMALGRRSTQSVQRAEDMNVWKPSTHPTRCKQAVHTPCGHLSLQHGRCTLTGGKPHYKNTCSASKTGPTPSRILFSYIHTYRTKL